MKEVIDNFSDQSELYKKFRPVYPKALYDEIMQWVDCRQLCWDCGTGNGQVAKELAAYFDQVVATDISESQIRAAFQKKNIHYKVERAEKTTFERHQFDLVTVAQAMHWFDQEQFCREVKRVTKNGGIIAIWGYGLIRIDKKVDPFVERFYREVVGPYWDQERRYIDQHYATIAFDFESIEVSKALSIKDQWTLATFEGYLNSWSAVKNFIKANGQNPVPELIQTIREYWPNDEKKSVEFPLFLRLGRVENEK
ncbi:MAG: methyltransferase [Saprospiraceae bacterium]|nr:MAG: methyltransferase [Saprospiraceae bacterium]